MAYRPRGTLARALYDKIHNDQYLEGYDMSLVRQVECEASAGGFWRTIVAFSGTR